MNETRKYVATKHSKDSNHIAKPESPEKTLCGKDVTGEGTDGFKTCGNCARLADRRGLVDAPAEVESAPADPAPADVKATREAWLLKAADYFRPKLEAAGLPLPARVHVSVGFSPAGPGGENSKTLGVCISRIASADHVNHIFISPEISDPVTVLATLVHELIHAADDCQSGHRGEFARVAKALGLAGKMTATVPGPELSEELAKLAADLGEYAHGQLHIVRRSRKPKAPAEMPADSGDETADQDQDQAEEAPLSSGPREQTNRHMLVRCDTDGCECGGYQVRTSRKWLKVGLPFCPGGNRMELAD
ncbi:hypothetical protein GCM10010466_29520 [Planomonospora alba]|uniref:SprT-like domain-containing protein n=1 Tax=Planomonospora alba TaxID=161354 RepID=A0ABP6N5J3_9ACTN